MTYSLLSDPDRRFREWQTHRRECDPQCGAGGGVFVLKVDGVIFLRADFCGGLDERAQRIDMEVRFYALQDGRNALEPHAGVDIFARERAKVVRRVADAVELRKDEVPNFDFALRGLMIDFGTRAAYSVWSLARRGGGPEVFVFVEILKFFGRQLDFFEPNLRGFVVVFVDGCRKHSRVDREPFFARQEFPSPVNRFALEIVPKAEIAEHFKERMVERRAADIVDVARTQAFLAGSRAKVLRACSTGEAVFELVHARRREQNGRIPVGNQNVARTTNAALRFEEL